MVVWKSGIGIRACSFLVQKYYRYGSENSSSYLLTRQYTQQDGDGKEGKGEMWEVGGFWGFNQGKKPGLQGGTLHKVYYRVLVIVFTRDFKAGKSF